MVSGKAFPGTHRLERQSSPSGVATSSSQKPAAHLMPRTTWVLRQHRFLLLATNHCYFCSGLQNESDHAGIELKAALMVLSDQGRGLRIPGP